MSSYAPTAKHSQAALPDEAIDYSMKTSALKIKTSSSPTKQLSTAAVTKMETEEEEERDEDEEERLVVDDTTDDEERKSKATTVSPKGDPSIVSPNVISSGASATSDVTSFSSDECVSSSSGSHSPTSQSSIHDPQPQTTIATSAAIQRPNVIQNNPVHRPIPLKSNQSAFSIPHPQHQQQPPPQLSLPPVNPDTLGPFLRHASQLNLNNLLDYWRRAVFPESPGGRGPAGGSQPPPTAGGLWMQPGMPHLGSTPGNSRPPPSLYGGRAPLDESPLSTFAATAGNHGFPPPGYTQLYAAAAAAAVAKHQPPATDLPSQTQSAFFGANAGPLGSYPYHHPSIPSTQSNLASVAAAAVAAASTTQAPNPPMDSLSASLSSKVSKEKPS